VWRIGEGKHHNVENRPRTLGLVCETWGKNLGGLLAQAKVGHERFENDPCDFINPLFAKGERADDISNKLKAVKSRLESNGSGFRGVSRLEVASHLRREFPPETN